MISERCMDMLLSECKKGTRASVVGVTGDPRIKQRLMVMGITPGVDIEVVKFAPLGDPMELDIRGYSLSIRKSEASTVIVKPL